MSRALAVLAVAVLAVAAAASAQGTDCSALDRDYCMIHEADCYYDEETHTCGKMTCTIYQDYAMCMADRQHFGPCEFNWETNTCHEKGIPVTCSAFDHCFDGRCECPTDRCDYHQNQGLCLEKGMDVPCEFFVGDECPTDRCTNDEMGCQSTLEAKACSDINDEADCKKKKGCDFVASLNICWPSDLQDSIPCSMYMDGSSCPTDRCIAVETYPGVSFCLLKDRTPVCEMYGSQEYCVTPCEWNKEIMSCTDPAIGVQCNLFSGTGQCPPDKCKAVNDQCFYPNEPIDCSSFDIYNPGSCDKSAGCYADCDKMLCMACPSTGPCPVNNCTGTDPGFVCDQYTDQSSCDGDASCKWDPNGVCIPAGAPEPCGEFSTESDCENAGFCNWDGSVCVECTGPNCTPIGPTVSPDTGKACNTYTDESCPYPRCFFEFGPDGDGACRAATCYDLHEEDFCSKNKTCTWDADIQACYIKADGVPCNDIYDQTLCTQENDCAWDKEEMRCAGKDTGKECATYSFEECPERCELDYDSSKCTDKACAMFWEEASCKAQKRCTWEADLNVCYSDPTPSKACDAFASYEQCPPNRCIWVFEDGKEECHSMPCSQWYDEDKCKAHDCTWGNFQCYSDPNPNKPCSSFEDVECPMNRCVLDFEAATTKCVDKSCNDFYEEADCKAHDCTWDANRYDCYKDTDPSKSCDKFDAQRTCPTNRCVWDYDTMICRTISCQDIYDPESCTASPKGCAWSDQYGVCYIKGEQIPCSTFNYNQEECPKDHCSWFDSGSAQLCYPTGGSVPCSDIYDEDTCGKAPKKACAWNSDEARCTDA